MKLKLLLPLLALVLLCGCNAEDNIGAIFSGAWKLNNFYTTSNWKDDSKRIPIYDPKNPEDLEKLELINQPGKFMISFENGAFSGVSDEKTFSGTWQADGKERTVFIRILTEGNTSNILGRNFMEALKNARYYSGDSNMLRLYPEGRKSYIQFNRRS